LEYGEGLLANKRTGFPCDYIM